MSDSLHLCLLTSKLSPAAGGLATSVPAMAHGLSRFADLRIDVLGTCDPHMPEAWRDWGPSVRAETVIGPSALQYAPAIQRHLSQLNPDVIDVQGLWTYPSFANLIHHNRHGTPYVVTPRGMLDPWARRNSSWKKYLVSKLFETRHLHSAQCLRATAEMEAVHFRAMGLQNPIAIVPNGVEVNELRPRHAGRLRRVLFLGRIHPKKGIAYLLRAWAHLEKQHTDWELVIAGFDEGGHEADMKRLADELGLMRVSFPGPVFGEDKLRLYRESDLFVLPTHAENFGLVIAEALAQEVPVITTRNAPWAGLETERCGWWIPLDQAALSLAMAEALARPQWALQEMGRRGREWMLRDYGWQGVVERLRDVYHWVARGGVRPSVVHVD